MELLERAEQLERELKALRPELHFPSTATLEHRLRWLEIVMEEMRAKNNHGVYAETLDEEKLRKILAHTVYIKQDRITLMSLTADPASCVAGDMWFRSDLKNAKLAIDAVVANAKPVPLNVSDANAAVGDVLAPQTFYSVAAPKKTGTMPSKVGSATIFTPTTSDQAITQGYYGGAVGDGKVSGDANLVAAKIATGVTIFGVAGSYTGVGTAAAAQVLTGYTFSNATLSGASGSMPNSSYSSVVTPTTSQQQITAGYHAGTGNDAVAGDANLVAANIKSGVSIFGVAGTLTPGTATHDIEAGAVGGGSCTSTGYTLMEQLVSVGAGTDLDLATLTQTYAANSLAEGYGYALVTAAYAGANIFKLRLYMGGVQVAESAYIATTAFDMPTVNGNKALSGSNIVKISVHNYGASAYSVAPCGVSTVSGCTYCAGVFAGSVKVV